MEVLVWVMVMSVVVMVFSAASRVVFCPVVRMRMFLVMFFVVVNRRR